MTTDGKTLKAKTLGQAAYEGYFKKSGGRSLATLQTLPTWEETSEEIREAWEASAAAVMEHFTETVFRDAVTDDERVSIALAVMQVGYEDGEDVRDCFRKSLASFVLDVARPKFFHDRTVELHGKEEADMFFPKGKK